MNDDIEIGSVVAVEWLDAWFDLAETSAQDWEDACTVITYGALHRRGHVITVASETMEDGVFRAVTHIPAGMVLSITKLT